MPSNAYIIKWDPELSVGIPWIDEQHKNLLKHVENLLNAVLARESVGKIDETLHFLIDYVRTHFATEERYMSKYNYPGFGAHKAKHDEFRTKMRTFAGHYASKGGSEEFGMAIEKEIWEWYKNHVAKTDQFFGQFLREEGHVEPDEDILDLS